MNQPPEKESLARLHDEIAGLQQRLAILEGRTYPGEMGPHVPQPPFPKTARTVPFMPFSSCNVADFMHPRYLEICGLMKHPFFWHRKLWEWVFVTHHLLESGAVVPGSKGLVFGVGSERLPAVFASLGAKIVATDAPADIGESKGWAETGQHINSLTKIRFPDIIDGAIFDQNVSFETCDMNNIQPGLKDFDFNWSSCCFEHLGSLELGLQFVINAVEKTLKIGGVAVHTTEFNLSSNDETLKEGGTVIFRRRDMESLVQRLRDRGHHVQDFIVAPESHFWDHHVDVPPFAHVPHLKLLLAQYVSTSAGIVVRRGR